MKNKIFNYNGNNITFQIGGSDVMVNLTEIAKAFPDKNLSQIVNSQEIQEYVDKLSEIQNYISTDLLRVTKGGHVINQGTWAHQKVALRVCQKLSSDFAIWVDTKIEELLTTGRTSIVDLSRKELAQMVIQAEEEKERLLIENSRLDERNQFVDIVFKADDLLTGSKTCKALNLPYGNVTLYKKLREMGIFFKNSNEPKQEYLNRGYFRVKEIVIGEKVKIQTYITQKGLGYIAKRLNVIVPKINRVKELAT